MSNFDLRSDDREAEDASGAKKIVFMGTGPFALPMLEILIASSQVVDVVAVVTKPDAKIGRGNKSDRALHENPIKETALNQGIHVGQPHKIDASVIAELQALTPDLIIVASYGKILPKELLAIAPYGAINAHASLLPQYRGASPIQNALLNGDTQTGVTLIQMDEGLDTGPMIAREPIPIGPDDTAPQVEALLATLSANLMTQAFPLIFSGSMTTTQQDHKAATLCQLIDREDGHIAWTDSAQSIYNRYRALTPWPGIFSYWKKSATETIRIKFITLERIASATAGNYTTGEVFLEEKKLCVKTSDGAVAIIELQREGKSLQDASTFINGNTDFVGAKLI